MTWWIVQTACISALLAAVVAVVGRAGRLSPAVKHALWLLVLVKLVTPPLPFYRLPAAVEKAMADGRAWLMRDERRQGEPAGSAARGDVLRRPSAAELFLDEPPQTSEGLLDQDLWVAAERTEVADGPGGEVPLERLSAFRQRSPVGDADLGLARPDNRLAWLLVGGWLLGAIPLAAVQAVRIVRLRRLLAPSTPVPAWLDRLVQQVAGQLNIRPPRVVVIPAFCSPLICALGRPRLLWPAELSEQLPDEARRAVLLHELAHLRRRDHWVAWLELAVGVLWWFNPLYWYVRHQLRENAELACDAWVVGLLPSGRRAYAQALIEVTEFVSFAPAAMPAVAMGNVARRTLERRLTMIMRESTSYRVPLLGTGLIGLSLLAILPGFSGGQDTLPSRGKAPAESLPQGSDAAPLNAPLPAIAPLETLALPASEPDGAVATAPETADKEHRIRQLEAQLNQLQAAVQALRTGDAPADQKVADRKVADEKPAGQEPAEGQPKGPGESIKLFRSEYRNQPGAFIAQHNPYAAYATQHHLFAASRPGYQIETLTRARYKLTEQTANALASFIQEHVKNDVEARVAGDTLTVIASQEDQAKIGAFIDLLRDESQPGARGHGQKQSGGLPKQPSSTGALVPSNNTDALPFGR